MFSIGQLIRTNYNRDCERVYKVIGYSGETEYVVRFVAYLVIEDNGHEYLSYADGSLNVYTSNCESMSVFNASENTFAGISE